jgi:hypothetical protein
VPYQSTTSRPRSYSAIHSPANGGICSPAGQWRGCCERTSRWSIRSSSRCETPSNRLGIEGYPFRARATAMARFVGDALRARKGVVAPARRRT